MNGYVLAGGASRRMGVDKARLPHGDLPMGAHLCGLLAAVGLRPALVRRGPDPLPWIGADGRALRVVDEPDAGPRHPLRGVLAALEDAGAAAVVIPCDLPGLDADALARLLDRPCVADGHPLVAHLPLASRDRARALADQGAPAWALVEGLPRVLLPPAALVDRNQGGGPWPMERLRDRLRGMGSADLDRVLAGERERQRARGILDPSDPALKPAP